MAHTTENGVTVERATSYHAPAANGSPERLDTILRRAERLVRDLAPPSDPVDNEYKSTAADAELAVFEFLWESPAHIDRETVLDATTYNRGQGALLELVRNAMGRFYIGPREIPPNASDDRPPSVVHNVSPDPLW